MAIRSVISGLALSAVFAAQAVPPDLPVTRLEGGASHASGGPADAAVPERQVPLGALPITRLEDPAGAGLDGARRISLTISRPIALRDLLLLLVNSTPLSIVADEDVNGTFVGDLKDLSLRQALEAVLFPRGLDYEMEGTLIRVFPRKSATRLFDVNYVNVRRASRRGVRSGVSTDGRQPPAAADLTATSESDPLDELASGVQALLSGTGRMHVDRVAGIVQVTDFSERLDQIAVYIEAVQLRASRQVRIEARVFEVALNNASAMSVDWTAIAARSPVSPPPPSGRQTSGLSADPEALMKAIAEQGTITMIAAPHVLALNNEPVIMRVGTQSASFDSASTAAPDGSRQRESRAVPVLEGLTLTVIPQIAADGIVQLSVSPTYATRRSQARSPEGGTVPVLRIDEADTMARVRAGETIVVAGFLDERETTKTNAGLSGLFGAQSHATTKHELVILLTPTVVSPGARAGDGGYR